MSKKVIITSGELRSFSLELFKHFYDLDKLSAVYKYFIKCNPKYKIHVLQANNVELKGVFLEATKEQIIVENQKKVKGKPVSRWFETPFEIEGKFFFLSNQWSENEGKSNPTFRELKQVIEYCYSNYNLEKKDKQYCLIFNGDVSNVEKKCVVCEQNSPREMFSISKVIEDIESTGLLYDSTLIKRFAFSLMSKRFLILSGLAGSGKTQLALAFASALIEDDTQMCVVPVGADWTNREPLFGFPNALVEGKYVKPESGVLDLLIEANKKENKDKPYFLILDEMNMSYVERYFADFLSAMESHKAIPLWNGEDENEAPRSISLPKNLFIIGTINVDETTYMFSPKVLDRANVIEFKISDEEMDSFLNKMNPIDRDSILYKDAGMGASFVELAGKDELADDGAIKETLSTFFRNLKSVNAEFGYRSATEIYRFVWQAQNNDDCADDEKMKMDEILDCAIVQKLLPKLHGSRKKLEPVLQALWKECFDKDNKDLVMSRDNVQKAKYPLTADKIQRMHDAAQINGFTSFAEA